MLRRGSARGELLSTTHCRGSGGGPSHLWGVMKMGCERRTLTGSAMRGARVRLEPPSKASARPVAWFLSSSNMSVQGAAAATSVMLMAPRLGREGGVTSRSGRPGKFTCKTGQNLRGPAEGVCEETGAETVTVCGLTHIYLV